MSSKVIIVTGASRGIGLAITKCLLAAAFNCKLVLLSRGKEALSTIQSSAIEQIEILPGDAADFTLAQKAVDLALKKWGRVDGLVINHGQVEPVEKIADADVDNWRASFDVNVFSAIALIKAAIPHLRTTKGRIVLTSSGAAVKGTSTWGCYGATKAVLNHIPLTLQKEEPDITTIAIRPGVVDTQMQETLAAEHFTKMDQVDADRFKTLRAEGKMLPPSRPGNVMARLVVDAPKELGGLFFSWDDEKLAEFQDK